MSQYLSNFQEVDFALGELIAGAYASLASQGAPKGFAAFLQRPPGKKIYRCVTDDLHETVRKIAGKEHGGAKAAPVIPVVAYYRLPGLESSDERPAALSQVVYDDTLQHPYRISVVPVQLTYDIAFLAWDRLTLDHMTLAWHCYIMEFGRTHSRVMARYSIDGDVLEVAVNIVSPRDILTESTVPEGSGERLWAARTRFYVKTQALYGHSIEVREQRFIGGAGRVG